MTSEKSLLERAVDRLGADGLKKALSVLPAEAREAIAYDWSQVGRPKQQEPSGNWRIWLVLAGRGFGKNRTASEWIRQRVASGKARRINILARSAAEARDTIVEGDSGLLSVGYPDERPTYEPSKRRLTWPNGATAILYSAEEPDSLRGTQCDTAYADELATYGDNGAWDQLLFGLRLGQDPRAIVTTTPRPVPIIKGLIADKTCHVTRGSTYENRSNLAPAFLEQVVKRYEGTRQGRQELYAEVLEGAEGALWSRELIETTRVHTHPILTRTVVAVDPAVSNTENSDSTGIIVAGLAATNHAYILADYTLKAGPLEWAKVVERAYNDHRASLVIAEGNQGGDLVKSNLQVTNPSLPVRLIRAHKGKALRAEPVATLFEQYQVHILGYQPDLEDQMCSWQPGLKSPDRIDAMVYAIRELLPFIDLSDPHGPQISESDRIEQRATMEARAQAEATERPWTTYERPWTG